MKKNMLLAMLCGICAALALPPFFYLPLAVIAFSGLYLLLAKAENFKQAFWLGWSFGFAHHVVGLYWISNALLTDPAQFGWMIPFAISLIPAALAIYIGLVAVAHKKWAKDHFFSGFGVVLFAALWVAGEWLRAHLFSGFPWNLMGYALNIHDVTLQAASVVGVYGLSFGLVLAATAPALFYQRRWVFMGICSLLLPVVIVGFGVYRLSHAEVKNTTTPLHIVQANINQQQRWSDAERVKNLFSQLRLSKNAPPGSIIIWPESAVPYILHEEPNVRKMISQVIGSHTLITGSTRLQRKAGDDFDVWNSLEVMQKDEIVNFYNKNRLVPFGEFVPLRELIPFVDTLTNGNKDFSRGPGATTLYVAGAPDFSPLICYEVIYPDYRPEMGHAKWLINITNDAWFGLSSGPYQHFEMARMRAVEQGLPLIRAANTGISAIVDGYGRVNHLLPLGKQGVIDAFLPSPAIDTPYYSRFGDWMIGILIIISLILSKKLIKRQNSVEFTGKKGE